MIYRFFRFESLDILPFAISYRISYSLFSSLLLLACPECVKFYKGSFLITCPKFFRSFWFLVSFIYSENKNKLLPFVAYYGHGILYILSRLFTYTSTFVSTCRCVLKECFFFFFVFEWEKLALMSFLSDNKQGNFLFPFPSPRPPSLSLCPFSLHLRVFFNFLSFKHNSVSCIKYSHPFWTTMRKYWLDLWPANVLSVYENSMKTRLTLCWNGNS